MNFGFNEPLELDVSRYKNDPDIAAFAELVRELTENRRVEQGGVRGGQSPPGVLELMLRNESANTRQYVHASGQHWYEFLTDFDVIQHARERLGCSRVEFLSMCIEKLRPPNWETLFWMRAYFEAAVNEVHLELKFAMREEEVAKQSRVDTATKGAKAKLAIDPKQKDKALVKECWDEWQKQPNRYKGKAAFARDMREKYPSLDSQPVIEGWCRKWERG